MSRISKEPVGPASRRALLKGAALTGVGALAGGAVVNAISPSVLPEMVRFEPNHSYWSRELPPANPPLKADLEADVVVIGGGFTGLSSAYYLAKALPRRRVVLFEAKTCGNGASGRNGAMVLNVKDKTDRPDIDRRLYELTVGNIRVLQQLSAATGIDCELAHGGALTVFNTPEQFDAAKADVAETRSRGIPVELWDKAKTTATIGTNAYHGGVFDPGAGQVHPGKLVRMWKAAAEAAGVKIYEGTVVARIADGPIISLSTEAGHTVRAPQIVLATNAYTSKLGHLRSAVAPIVEYVGMTPELSTAQLAAIGWKAGIPFNDSRREVYYAGLTRSGRIHFGGGPVDYGFNNSLRTPSTDAKRYANLHQRFAEIYPSLAGVQFEVTWDGFIDMTLDAQPSVGQLGRHANIFYGIGYSGEGVNMTSVFGRVIADLATGQRSEWTWLPFLDRTPPYLPNEPFRWLGIGADIGSTRLTA